jgi:hypothetical protein
MWRGSVSFPSHLINRNFSLEPHGDDYENRRSRKTT